MESKAFVEKISGLETVAICVPAIQNLDTLYSIVYLHEILRGANSKITISLLYDTVPPAKAISILDSYEISHKDSAPELNYVVTIDYGDVGLERITHFNDEESGELKFYIYPNEADKRFDFKNITYKTEGESFDLVITVGANGFDDFDKLYQESRSLFIDSDTIAFTRTDKNFADEAFVLRGNSLLIDLIDLFLEDSSQTALKAAATGLIHTQDMLEGDPVSRMWVQLGEIARKGVKVGEALDNVYYQKSFENVVAYSLLMEDILYDDETKIAWAKVTLSDLKRNNIKPSQLDLKGRIPFHISKDIDLSIAVFEVADSQLRVIIESRDPEKYDTTRIAGVFSGYGSKSHSTFKIDDLSIEKFESRFFMVLKDVYGLNVDADREVEDKTPRIDMIAPDELTV